MTQVVGLLNNSFKLIANTAWIRARICKLQKGCIRLAATSDKIYQFLTHGRWFSPSTPASSTTKTGRHDIAEILLTVALKTKNQSINQSNRTIYPDSEPILVPVLLIHSEYEYVKLAETLPIETGRLIILFYSCLLINVICLVYRLIVFNATCNYISAIRILWRMSVLLLMGIRSVQRKPLTYPQSSTNYKHGAIVVVIVWQICNQCLSPLML